MRTALGEDRSIDEVEVVVAHSERAPLLAEPTLLPMSLRDIVMREQLSGEHGVGPPATLWEGRDFRDQRK